MARALGQIPARVEGGFHVVVESPRGARVKWKYEPSWNAFAISRPLPLGLAYPYDWGFVPSSRAPDGDPLDAMIVWDQESIPGTVVPCRAIGVLKIEQDSKEKPGKRERNDRLLAVPLSAPRHELLTSVFDLSERERDELEQFFQAVVAFQEKNLTLLGWNGADEAERVLASCIRTGKKR
jgi:inorganic pyrophosphatase